MLCCILPLHGRKPCSATLLYAFRLPFKRAAGKSASTTTLQSVLQCMQWAGSVLLGCCQEGLWEAEHPCPAESGQTMATQETPHSIAKGSMMNYRNKNKATESIFHVCWCNHIFQLICLICLFPFDKIMLKLLLSLCPSLWFCYIPLFLPSNLSASTTVILAFLKLSSFMNENTLNCFFPHWGDVL